jgi:hypothetical protein
VDPLLLGEPVEGSVYLHVGLKKTGTSYLQSIFRASTEELLGQGLALVPKHEPAGHRLALAILGRKTAGDPLGALPRQLAAASGNRCLITQEKLGGADAQQITGLAPALAGHELHVVVTVRDVARTIPSAWQQYVKAGRPDRYDEFLDALLSEQRTDITQAFWRDHGVVDLVRRWGRLTTPSRTHVVVVPPEGSPPEMLLSRFCTVIGVQPDGLANAVAARNESLGLAQVEVLRRLNETRGDHAAAIYGQVYKREFARGVLAAQQGRRPVLPAGSEPWCRTYTERVVAELGSGGYDVVGDLEDLRPPGSAFTAQPQEVSDPELSTAAIAALGALLDRRAGEVARARASKRRQPGEQT